MLAHSELTVALRFPHCTSIFVHRTENTIHILAPLPLSLHTNTCIYCPSISCLYPVNIPPLAAKRHKQQAKAPRFLYRSLRWCLIAARPPVHSLFQSYPGPVSRRRRTIRRLNREITNQEQEGSHTNNLVHSWPRPDSIFSLPRTDQYHHSACA